MSRPFTKVVPTLWRSRRFRELPDNAKLLFVYLLTNGHQNSAGCYALPDGYACDDLVWEVADLVAARDVLIEADLIDYDPESGEILIRRWFKHNPPMNQKHYQGTERLVSGISSDRLRDAAGADLTPGWPTAQPRPINVQPAPSGANGISAALLETPIVKSLDRTN
jgi:hypothetical protein